MTEDDLKAVSRAARKIGELLRDFVRAVTAAFQRFIDHMLTIYMEVEMKYENNGHGDSEKIQMTAEAKEAALALFRCKIYEGHQDFAEKMFYRAAEDDPWLTPKQHWYLWKLTYRYRKQIIEQLEGDTRLTERAFFHLTGRRMPIQRPLFDL